MDNYEVFLFLSSLSPTTWPSGDGMQLFDGVGMRDRVHLSCITPMNTCKQSQRQSKLMALTAYTTSLLILSRDVFLQSVVRIPFDMIPTVAPTYTQTHGNCNK